MAGKILTSFLTFFKRFFATVLYSTIGALLFVHIENKKIEKDIQDTLKQIDDNKIILDTLRVKYETLFNCTLNGTTYDSFVAEIRDVPSLELPNKWNTDTGVHFAWTILTTIGYGVVVPKSDGGKILTIFYSLFGIPLCLFMLSASGAFINSLLEALVTFIEIKCLKGDEVHKMHVKIIIADAVLTVAMILTASAEATMEYGWSYLDGFYAWWVTSTTVGFGDFVPHTKGQSGAYIFLTLVLTIIILSTVASMINAITELIDERAKKQLSKRPCPTLCPCFNNKTSQTNIQATHGNDGSGGNDVQSMDENRNDRKGIQNAAYGME